MKAALKSEEILDEQRLRESEQALELINTHTHTHCSPATLHADPSPLRPPAFPATHFSRHENIVHQQADAASHFLRKQMGDTGRTGVFGDGNGDMGAAREVGGVVGGAGFDSNSLHFFKGEGVVGTWDVEPAHPSDLIPELQGRFPIRVELDALTSDDFMRILVEPDASLTEQYRALLATEEVTLEFAEDGIRRIAETAFQVNENTENIGARRLHTILERLLEEVSFTASNNSGSEVKITAEYVDENISELAQDEDLSRYIL